MRSLLTLSILFITVAAQGGGMAELKSITGDAPYSGMGNAPGPIPQPMGFWGRPVYSPMRYGGGLYGGYGGGYGDRFSSMGHSPYEVVGSSQFGSRRYPSRDDSLLMAMMSFLDGAQSPFDSRPSPRRTHFSGPSPTTSQLTPSVSSRQLSVQPDDTFSLPSNSNNGLGGFYKGKGN